MRLPLPADDPDQDIDRLNDAMLLEGRMQKKAPGYWGPAQPMPSGAEAYEPLPDDRRPATIRVVQGRRDIVDMTREKGMSILWQYGGLEADGTPAPETPAFRGSYQLVTTPEQPDNQTRSWEIHFWAYETSLILPAGSAPADVEKPAYEVENFSSRLRMRIAAHGASGGMIRDLDVAQGMRLTLRAAKVTVFVLYPQPALLQADGAAGQYNVGLGGGLICNSTVGAMVSVTDTDLATHTGTLTQVVRVNAGVVDRQVLVPPGARRVTIYQSSLGAAATLEWRLLRGGVAVGPSLGSLPMGPARRIDNVDRIGNAGMITTGPADAALRFFTFVWEIDV